MKIVKSNCTCKCTCEPRYILELSNEEAHDLKVLISGARNTDITELLDNSSIKKVSGIHDYRTHDIYGLLAELERLL